MNTQGAYLELVAGPDRLVTANGDEVRLVREDLVGAVEKATGLHRRVVIWVHESAAAAWHLPADPKALGTVLAMPPDAASSDGWIRLSRDVHVALPGYSGDFEGTASPAELARALRMFRDLVGIEFLYSAPSTALHLIETRFVGKRPTRPAGVPFAPSAFAIPAHTWTYEAAPALDEIPGDPLAGRYAQLFDRRGSYLAAWRSCELPDGEWSEVPSTHAGAADAPGYYLCDLRRLGPYLAAQGLHDPFARAPRPDAPAAEDGRAWLTQPLAALAGELAEEAGVRVVVERAIVGARKVRPLDHLAGRLAEARSTLEAAHDEPLAPILLELVRDAYVRGTAHLEFGRRPPHPLHRPEWRHTIVDRHVANTWRSLRRATQRPLIVGGVDGAVFVVSGPGSTIEGLHMGPELGSWRRRGEPMPLTDAIARLSHGPGGARDLLFALMAAA